jgi:hypothetical protein
MGIVQQQLCDGCGEILTGVKGTVYHRKPALLISGQIAIYEVDPHTKWRDHWYATPHANCELAFCDYTCLQAYIEHRVKVGKQKKMERLQQEAGEERLRKGEDRDY